MKNSRCIYFAVAFSLCFSLISSGQRTESRLPTISSALKEYLTANHFQDIFIHCDRDLYVAGEDIFMKAYLFERDSLFLSGADTYIYAELINPLNVPVAQIKILVDDGTGKSVMSIPDTVMNGRYLLRAYTSGMKNSMPYGCFMNSIIIVNPFSKRFADLDFGMTPGSRVASSLNFWPEGGKLVAGISSRVGFYSADKFGNPAKFQGVLKDENGKIISAINADSTGLGIFEFTPSKGGMYTAVNTTGGVSFSLPAVADEGFSIRVDEGENDSLKIVLKRSSGTDPENAFVELIIRSLGKIVFSQKVFLINSQSAITLPEVYLEEGINDIVVFDGSGKPAAERYIYIYGKEINEPSASGVQFGKREKAALDISTGELKSGLPVKEISAGISFPVSGNSMPLMNDHLVFGSEYRIDCLKQDIVPLFLRSSRKERNILQLGITDNLISWEKVMATGQKEAGFTDESDGQYLVISSSSVSMTTEGYKPAFMTSPGKNPDLRYSLPDKTGRYLFFIENGGQIKDLVIQMPDSVVRSGYRIESSFSDRFISSKYDIDTVRPDIPDHVRLISRNFQVMKIYNIPVTGLREKPVSDSPSKSRFYGRPDQELILNKYINLPAMQEVFFELIPAVSLRTTNKIPRFNVIDPEKNTVLEGEPLMFIDGVKVAAPGEILGLNPDHVERIDIVSGEYLVGDFIFPGIISVITKKGDFSEATLPPNSIRIRYRLFDPPAEYISPDYSDPDTKKRRIPDFRNTLFWSYDLKPEAGILRPINFSTSDLAAEYDITLAGIDSSGKPVSFRKTININ